MESESDTETMRCISCKEMYAARDTGTCKECYEKASETEQELKREIEDLKAKVAFLRFWSPLDHAHHGASTSPGPLFPDVVLVASDDGLSYVPVPAHKAVLVNHSPVFKTMLENEMEKSRSGIIKISDVKHLKGFYEKFLVSKLNWDNSLMTYAFSPQHGAKLVLDTALCLITDNMDKLTKNE
ncbi:BTB/POZ domain-containing protein [Gossypium australe]|uniref:BTB/POZ domain-containing protein n=1 Tax=Gossypium australe TaxID=47621 RepID=A0A5B6WW27_9ROSI|nr:BTB/POZ domain-containing protein [Gossypium australe]